MLFFKKKQQHWNVHFNKEMQQMGIVKFQIWVWIYGLIFPENI